MTLRDTPVLGTHPAALLLPAFVNGTLSGEDRAYVAEHVESCAQCRRELDECRRLGEELRDVYASEPAPSPAPWQRVQEAIARERARARSVRWLGALDDALRALLAPHFAPTVALALVVAQFGLLAWLLGREQRPLGVEVTTRSVAPAPARLRVAFQPRSTAQEVASLLRGLGARVVDGPDEQGLYTVELPRPLDLRSRYPNLVRSAEEMSPR